MLCVHNAGLQCQYDKVQINNVHVASAIIAICIGRMAHNVNKDLEESLTMHP